MSRAPLTKTAASAPAGALRAQHQERQARVLAAWREHLRPNELLRALRHNADLSLRALLRFCPLPQGASLAATGGYGRGELYPGSDLDLMLLLAEAPSEAAQVLIQNLVAAIWDIGLKPGIAVRTLEQCREQAQADITVQTALLEARWLAGSRKLFQNLRQQMRADLDPQEFFLGKRTEMQQRHARFQDTAYALEPNCKESPGGLRDLQLLLWLARAAGLGDDWRAVARTELLTQTELRALRRAELAFKRLRIELHILAGRAEDRVLFDFQPQLAEIYGFSDQNNRRASELLMQRYYWAARVVSQINRLLLQSLEEYIFPLANEYGKELDENFRIRRNRLELARADAFERNPALLLRVFYVMQQHPGLLGMAANTMRAMWHARLRIDGQFRQNPINRRQFLQILQQSHGVVAALRDMSTWNILPRYLPVFRRIVGQMQHDLFHAYTVDQHILMVIRNLARFTQPEHAQEFPLASELAAEMPDYWLLYIAALFHDIAKGRGGDHSLLGALEVRRFALEHKLEDEQQHLLEFLVREHLSLSLFAQKRDLSDPAIIQEFAQRMGSVRYLNALYLLTIADIRGTSPKVWNRWKGKLLEDLYRLARVTLIGQQADTKTILEQRKQSAAQDIARHGISAAKREAFWAQLDIAYFLRHEASDIAWHTVELCRNNAPDEPIARARALGGQNILQILVYAPDRPDLFMDICRYFDRHGLSVQDARIHTTNLGQALDSFVVLWPEQDQLMAPDTALLAQDLQKSLLERGKKLQDRGSKHRPSRRSRVFPIMPSVRLQASESSNHWRLAINAADRIGLLRDLAKVFVEHGVSLKTAKIMTLGDRVEDVFILTGAILADPRQQRLFERKLLAVL